MRLHHVHERRARCVNAALLLDGLRELGLEPQVIPGEVEARLTFFGVAHDFAGERIIVADSGGGSTELATGVYAPERGVFALEERARWTSVAVA